MSPLSTRSRAARRPKSIAVLLPAALLCLLAPTLAAADEPRLAAPTERVTDQALYRAQNAYAEIENRLKALNEQGHPLAEYRMAKAQCWVDVSVYEYTGNDRSDFPEIALGRAEELVVELEAGKSFSAAGNQTAPVQGVPRLREDLWARLDRLKASPRFGCAAQAIACAEVELVHASTENAQFGWRHANPYIGMAEDLTETADFEASHCPANPAVNGRALVASTPPSSGVGSAPARFSLEGDALFAFGRGDLKGLSVEGRSALDALIAELTRGALVTAIDVIGHTDSIDVHHDPRRNQKLSEERARTVARYLSGHGLASIPIASSGKGASDPLVHCDETTLVTRAALHACLAPNRRVDIIATLRAASAPAH